MMVKMVWTMANFNNTGNDNNDENITAHNDETNHENSIEIAQRKNDVENCVIFSCVLSVLEHAIV